MENKNFDLIGLLKSYGMEDHSIAIINNYLYRASDKKELIDITLILDVLNYIGLSSNQIEKLLTKNPAILSFSLSEFMECAYVYSQIDQIDDLVDSTYRILNYKRMFVRDVGARISGMYRNEIFFAFLIEPESKAYDADSIFNYYMYKTFGTEMDSDKKLERIINESGALKIEGNSMSVDEYLALSSRRLYLKYKTSKLNSSKKR